MMRPPSGLPLPQGFSDADTYVSELLDFVSSHELWQLLTGGVHILDFFTKTPEFYSWLFNEHWRNFCDQHELEDILDFVLREDLGQFETEGGTWRDKPSPPKSLVQYVRDIRRLSLNRDFIPQRKQRSNDASKSEDGIPRHVAVGMKLKKIHEVDHFSRYIQQLTADVTAMKREDITHLVDFGSGQNYLGRTLASEPYNKHVIAVESRHHNIEQSKYLDAQAKVAPKFGNLVNKKEYKAQLAAAASNGTSETGITPNIIPTSTPEDNEGAAQPAIVSSKLLREKEGSGSVQYVEHRLEDWDLSAVIDEIVDESPHQAKQQPPTDDVDEPPTSRPLDTSNTSTPSPPSRSLLVMSIHSCGNLSHHGIRSILNPSVIAIAIIGCCYNLLTERLTPPSYKHPNLRPENNPWANPKYRAPSTGDPHGFPLSKRIEKHDRPVHLNITSRMLAVQAPANWGAEDSDAFFTRHFYRALLQRVFLDCGVVEAPSISDALSSYTIGGKINSTTERSIGGATQPIIIGSLRKSCYTSFTTYVRGALSRLLRDPTRGSFFAEKMGSITDEEIEVYEREYAGGKKDLSVVWTLMAFSAQLVEAVVVVDRWSWLREQDCVGEAWVESVFEYGRSPRNLVVVGVKK